MGDTAKVYTDVDESGFIVEPGHPQEGCELSSCTGFRRGLDVGRIVQLTTADPPLAKDHRCDWPDANDHPCCKPAVEWIFTDACEWFAVCADYQEKHRSGNGAAMVAPKEDKPLQQLTATGRITKVPSVGEYSVEIEFEADGTRYKSGSEHTGSAGHENYNFAVQGRFPRSWLDQVRFGSTFTFLLSQND
jgi:hypothetical protein